MKLSKANFTIHGATPLMMSNPAAMLKKADSRGPKKRSPQEEEAETAAYRDAKGWLVFPSLGVRNAIIEASSMHRVQRRSLKTFVSHIQIEPADFLPLVDKKNKPIKTYETDVRRVVNKTAGAIMVARPIVPEWSMSFTLLFDPQLLPSAADELFAMLLDDAGTRIGIGAYRPAKGGWFGRFTVG
jgi:hypothetical protein